LEQTSRLGGYKVPRCRAPDKSARRGGSCLGGPEWQNDQGVREATIKLRPEDAAGIPDAEFQDLIRAALHASLEGGHAA